MITDAVAEMCREDRVFMQCLSQQEQRELARAALTAASERIRVLTTTLDKARETIVLSIAFLGRDCGSPRTKNTTSQIITQLANTETTIRAALSHVEPERMGT
jgi:hypothetical protein